MTKINDALKSENEFGYAKPVIKVIGLGGGGCNAVDRMISLGYDDVEFIAANTDLQALQRNNAPNRLLIGPNLTHGLGSGGKPEVGERAALESEDEIRAALDGADIVFLTAGMGGGTGSGAISVAAKIAQDLGAITVSVVNTPFSFEAGKRINNARTWLSKLATFSDTLIAIPNDQLLKISPRNISLREAFEFADDVLRQGVTGISQLLTGVGVINVDFAHIRNVMLNGGGSLLAIGRAKGPDKVSKALYQALNHPLLEHLPIENATGIIANFTSDANLAFQDVIEGMEYLHQLTSSMAEIIPGQIIDETMVDEVQIILIITGIASTPIDSAEVEPKEIVYEIPEKKYVEKQHPEPSSKKKVVSEVALPVESVQEKNHWMNEDSYAPSYVFSEREEQQIGKNLPKNNSSSESKIEPPTFGDPAFDTYLSPLGLSGIEPASCKAPADKNDAESRPDLDIPTFIRRKM